MALSKDRLPGTAMVMNGFQWVTLSQLPWISTQLSPIFGQTQSRLVSYISQKCIIRSPFVVGLIIATFLGQTIKSQIFHLYGTSQAALMAVITKSKNAQQVSSSQGPWCRCGSGFHKKNTTGFSSVQLEKNHGHIKGIFLGFIMVSRVILMVNTNGWYTDGIFLGLKY